MGGVFARPPDSEPCGLKSKLSLQIHPPGGALPLSGGRKMTRDIPLDFKAAGADRWPAPGPDPGGRDLPSPPHETYGTAQDVPMDPAPAGVQESDGAGAPGAQKNGDAIRGEDSQRLAGLRREKPVNAAVHRLSGKFRDHLDSDPMNLLGASRMGPAMQGLEKSRKNPRRAGVPLADPRGKRKEINFFGACCPKKCGGRGGGTDRQVCW